MYQVNIVAERPSGCGSRRLQRMRFLWRQYLSITYLYYVSVLLSPNISTRLAHAASLPRLLVDTPYTGVLNILQCVVL